MLEFKTVKFEDKDLLQEYYSACSYESCEYSAGIKLFWGRFYPYEYALSSDGSLIVKYEESGNSVFEMPVSKDGHDIGAALDEIDEYCMKNEIVPVFSDVPEDLLTLLIGRYNFTKIENYRGSADYIYRVEDLRKFKGRQYSTQRNHINKFKSLYPDYTYRELKAGEDLSEFWSSYYGGKTGDSESEQREKEVAIDMVSRFSEVASLISGAIEIGGKTAALCIGEILGSRVTVHIEKALTGYEGVYPVMVSEFLKHLPEGIEYVNREDDSGERGLRISKLRYRPFKLLSKYVVLVQSELLYVDAVPCIRTERLTLDEITEADAAVYQGICLDDERNRYWGYDYRTDLEDEYRAAVPDGYFLKVARSDFEERMCLNLAVRLGDSMIGEVVLYESDYKGSIEIGCRLLKEYEGRGYGREAMLAAADWAIYAAGFRTVRAKCFKENIPSFRMLSSFMRKTGEDEAFCYFLKEC